MTELRFINGSPVRGLPPGWLADETRQGVRRLEQVVGGRVESVAGVQTQSAVKMIFVKQPPAGSRTV